MCVCVFLAGGGHFFCPPPAMLRDLVGQPPTECPAMPRAVASARDLYASIMFSSGFWGAQRVSWVFCFFGFWWLTSWVLGTLKLGVRGFCGLQDGFWGICPLSGHMFFVFFCDVALWFERKTGIPSPDLTWSRTNPRLRPCARF